MTSVSLMLLLPLTIAQPGYFHDCEPELFERQMSLNYMGSLHAAKAVYDGMLARNAGHICFISSTMALMGEAPAAAAAAAAVSSSSAAVAAAAAAALETAEFGCGLCTALMESCCAPCFTAAWLGAELQCGSKWR
jgi:3-dehydrosphinganine reductase